MPVMMDHMNKSWLETLLWSWVHPWETASEQTRASGEEATYARGLVFSNEINMERIAYLK